MNQKSPASPLIPLACLTLLCFILYAQTLSSSFHFDDELAIIRNPAIRELGDLGAIWDAFNTRFIAGLSFALNYSLGGLNVFGYHLFNVTCHLASSFLVYALVLLILKTPSMEKNSLSGQAGRIAFFSSLLFLVHPVQTQAVNFVWQRVASLATLFYLATLVLYVRARLTRRFKGYLAALGTTLLGMFTKEITFTLPLMILLVEGSFFGPWKEKGSKRLLFILPFMLTLAVIPLTLMRSGEVTLELMRSPSFAAPAAGGRTLYEVFSNMTKWCPSGPFSRHDYLLTQLDVLRTYLGLFVFPIRQNLDYDYPIAHHLAEPGTLFSLLVLIALLALALKLFRRQRLIAFGMLWFLITVSPESVILLPDVIFEHRLYLPTVGFAIFLPAVLFLLLKETRRFVALSSVIVLLFSIATYRRNQVWKDDITLWEDTVKKSPNNERAYNNLGYAYSLRKEYDQARRCYERAIELSPDYAEVYDNLGVIYGIGAEYEKAIQYHKKAIQLKPGYLDAYLNLAATCGRKGDYDKAIQFYQEAIQLAPGYADVYNNLGAAYGLKGDRIGLAKQIEKLRALRRDDLADQLERVFRHPDQR